MKNIGFKKFKTKNELFDKEMEILKPKKIEVKFDPNNLNHKDDKIYKLKQELEIYLLINFNRLLTNTIKQNENIYTISNYHYFNINQFICSTISII